MAHYFVNNENVIRDSMKCIISAKKLPKIWENNPPKLTYGLLLQTLFSVIDESSFWTSSDIVSSITIISGLTEERARGILQQPNNFKKKVNNAIKKNLTSLKFTQHLFGLVKGGQLFIPTSKVFKDPLQEAKKLRKKLNLKITELLNVISSLQNKNVPLK